MRLFFKKVVILRAQMLNFKSKNYELFRHYYRYRIDNLCDRWI